MQEKTKRKYISVKKTNTNQKKTTPSSRITIIIKNFTLNTLKIEKRRQQSYS